MKRIISMLVSIVMLTALLPVYTVSAVLSTSTYGEPTITINQAHPRVMFNSTTLATIRNNYSKDQNEPAKISFENYRDTATIGNGVWSTAVSSESANTGVKQQLLRSKIEYQIEAKAFDYVLNGNTTNGNNAVTQLISYLNSVQYSESGVNDITRDRGATIFHAAEVYDWCYSLMSSTQRNTIISKCESIAGNLEVGYPPSGKGNITGHGSESNIFRDLLAFGIAVYNERPDIYNYVMGRIEYQMVCQNYL